MYEIYTLDFSQGKSKCLALNSTLVKDTQPRLWCRCGVEESVSPPGHLQLGVVQGAACSLLPGNDEQMSSICLVYHPYALQALIWLSNSLLSNWRSPDLCIFTMSFWR